MRGNSASGAVSGSATDGKGQGSDASCFSISLSSRFNPAYRASSALPPAAFALGVCGPAHAVSSNPASAAEHNSEM
jgi:hypothetical protein